MRNAKLSSSKIRLSLAGVAVIGVALGALLLPSAAVAQQGGTGGLENGGVLSLHLGAQDYFGFRAPSGAGYAPTSKQQNIANLQGCKLGLSNDQLVTLTPAGGNNPNTGLVSDSIGVVSSGEGNGQPCGRFDKPPGQTLTMTLGSALGGKVVDYAEMDLELKFSAIVKVTGLLDGVQVGDPEFYQSSGSDSGPDSADGDNYRVRFPRSGTTTVNALKFEISSASGGASLEGGADGTQPCDPTDLGECGIGGFSLGQTLGANSGIYDTLFHLVEVDGILDCPSGTGVSQDSEDNPGVVESTLYRQENEIDPETGEPFPCVPIPYNLESGAGATLGCTTPQCILLQKDIGGQETQFIWKVTWNPESTDYPESATEFDFNLDGSFQPLQPCLEDTDGDHLPELPSTDGVVDQWCIMDTFVDFNPDTGQNTVTEWYFGKTDPGGKRL